MTGTDPREVMAGADPREATAGADPLEVEAGAAGSLPLVVEAARLLQVALETTAIRPSVWGTLAAVHPPRK